MLLFNHNVLRKTRFPIFSGSFTNLLCEKSKPSRALRLPIESGIVIRLFPEIDNISNDRNFPIDNGNFFISQAPKRIFLAEVRFPIDFGTYNIFLNFSSKRDIFLFSIHTIFSGISLKRVPI